MRPKRKTRRYASRAEFFADRQQNFEARLAALGFDSYAEYLASPHWQEFKQRYREEYGAVRCASCHDPKYELHHKTYDRLGAERISDVIPLCRQCHEVVHTGVNLGVGNLRSMTNLVVHGTPP